LAQVRIRESPRFHRLALVSPLRAPCINTTMGNQMSCAPVEAGKPLLIYWPIAGRGELARLIAVAGDLEMDEAPDCEDRASFGSPGSLPVLKHGNLKMAQSTAIENYLAGIAPKFASLTPSQRARDSMFMSIKEDVVAGCAKIIFGDRSLAPAETPKVVDKWFTVIEGLVPEKGFVNGLEFPTVADLAVLNIARGYMPFGSAYKHSGYDWAPKYPKMKALADRTAEAKGVKEYLASSGSMSQPMGDM